MNSATTFLPFGTRPRGEDEPRHYITARFQIPKPKSEYQCRSNRDKILNVLSIGISYFDYFIL